MNIVVFASGAGSNFNKLIEASRDRKIFSISALISNKKNCGAMTIAEENNIPVFGAMFKDNNESLKESLRIIREINPQLIVLAGYLRLIPEELIEMFPKSIINIHPALLPLFGGKGMYGIHVHEAVYQSGMKVSGATVHLVDTVYDRGKIIAQSCVSIEQCTNAEQIAKKVLEVEHKLLPKTVEQIANGEIILN